MRGEIAGDNPWNSSGIEWMTTSPPPKHNFPTPIVITQDPALVPEPGRGGGACRHLTAHAHAHAHPHLAHHFDTIEKQDYAARLGMWLFLGTEVLLFAGLFLGYTVYRHFYHEAFHDCSRALNITLGHDQHASSSSPAA